MTRIARVSFTTALPDTLEQFYREVFHFEPIGQWRRLRRPITALTRVEDSEGRAIFLRLGDQILELVTFSKPGQPYPPDVAANDLRFQHIAIVVSDMQAAYRALLSCRGWTNITHGGPQRLPPSSGGVTAFKFRDPEGHPLELLEFPDSNAPSVWQRRDQRGPFLGIDHSAISVADIGRSLGFYEKLLGFSVSGHSTNTGPEQERLDDLDHTLVQVTSLSPGTPKPPHLELLCYQRPKPHARKVPSLPSNDVAATRLVLELDKVVEITHGVGSAGADLITRIIPMPGSRQSGGLIHDPDGHAVELTERDA